MNYCGLICLILLTFSVQGQEKPPKVYDQDFFLTVDNDAFLVQTIDRYYSSGIFFGYRRTISSTSRLSSLVGKKVDKAFYSLGFAHVFYTPSDIKLRTIDQFDRPYAGLISLNFGLTYLRASKSIMSLKLDAGILGPGAGIAGLQKWYHNVIGAKNPQGWQFQIENSPLTTFSFNYVRSAIQKEKFEFFYEGSLAAGTVINYVKPGFSLRWGNFKPIESSTYTRSRLGSINHNSEKSEWKESYFFIKTFMSYVPYDATVEGNFIGQQSIHTEETQRLRYHIKYGWNLGLRRWDLGLAFNNVRRETREAKDHYFVTIDVLLRI